MSCILYVHHAHFPGESGLVYRAFLKSGGVKDMVAIKTGKGDFSQL